ncbi:hypothetical protein CYMTET_14592 [Cymbomonas tetramitiformis]|uniref:Uncharacterized protein n=1 Tax=Cymbomonas tetramitiformis TaxID=36881 RepID=A0AAE0L9U9_9CHLO|nr:hypothetical protein CYMTET_14592 [Cymbomonas tetramitiformis]
MPEGATRRGARSPRKRTVGNSDAKQKRAELEQKRNALAQEREKRAAELDNVRNKLDERQQRRAKMLQQCLERTPELNQALQKHGAMPVTEKAQATYVNEVLAARRASSTEDPKDGGEVPGRAVPTERMLSKVHLKAAQEGRMRSGNSSHSRTKLVHERKELARRQEELEQTPSASGKLRAREELIEGFKANLPVVRDKMKTLKRAQLLSKAKNASYHADKAKVRDFDAAGVKAILDASPTANVKFCRQLAWDIVDAVLSRIERRPTKESVKHEQALWEQDKKWHVPESVARLLTEAVVREVVQSEIKQMHHELRVMQREAETFARGALTSAILRRLDRRAIDRDVPRRTSADSHSAVRGEWRSSAEELLAADVIEEDQLPDVPPPKLAEVGPPQSPQRAEEAQERSADNLSEPQEGPPEQPQEGPAALHPAEPSVVPDAASLVPDADAMPDPMLAQRRRQAVEQRALMWVMHGMRGRQQSLGLGYGHVQPLKACPAPVSTLLPNEEAPWQPTAPANAPPVDRPAKKPGLMSRMMRAFASGVPGTPLTQAPPDPPPRRRRPRIRRAASALPRGPAASSQAPLNPVLRWPPPLVRPRGRCTFEEAEPNAQRALPPAPSQADLLRTIVVDKSSAERELNAEQQVARAVQALGSQGTAPQPLHEIHHHLLANFFHRSLIQLQASEREAEYWSHVGLQAADIGVSSAVLTPEQGSPTAVRASDDGMLLAVGTSTSHLLVYDMREQPPLLVRSTQVEVIPPEQEPAEMVERPVPAGAKGKVPGHSVVSRPSFSFRRSKVADVPVEQEDLQEPHRNRVWRRVVPRVGLVGLHWSLRRNQLLAMNSSHQALIWSLSPQQLAGATSDGEEGPTEPLMQSSWDRSNIFTCSAGPQATESVTMEDAVSRAVVPAGGFHPAFTMGGRQPYAIICRGSGEVVRVDARLGKPEPTLWGSIEGERVRASWKKAPESPGTSLVEAPERPLIGQRVLHHLYFPQDLEPSPPFPTSKGGKSGDEGANDDETWTMGHGRRQGLYRGHSRPVVLVHFLPDSALMLTVDAAGEVRLWADAETPCTGLGWHVPRAAWQMPMFLPHLFRTEREEDQWPDEEDTRAAEAEALAGDLEAHENDEDAAQVEGQDGAAAQERPSSGDERQRRAPASGDMLTWMVMYQNMPGSGDKRIRLDRPANQAQIASPRDGQIEILRVHEGAEGQGSPPLARECVRQLVEHEVRAAAITHSSSRKDLFVILAPKEQGRASPAYFSAHLLPVLRDGGLMAPSCPQIDFPDLSLGQDPPIYAFHPTVQALGTDYLYVPIGPNQVGVYSLATAVLVKEVALDLPKSEAISQLELLPARRPTSKPLLCVCVKGGNVVEFIEVREDDALQQLAPYIPGSPKVMKDLDKYVDEMDEELARGYGAAGKESLDENEDGLESDSNASKPEVDDSGAAQPREPGNAAIENPDIERDDAELGEVGTFDAENDASQDVGAEGDSNDRESELVDGEVDQDGDEVSDEVDGDVGVDTGGDEASDEADGDGAGDETSGDEMGEEVDGDGDVDSAIEGDEGNEQNSALSMGPPQI